MEMTLSLREKLQDGKPLLGTVLTIPAPEMAEALALVGFDWVFIDLEHGSLSIRDAQTAVQAVANRAFTLVRVPDGTAENIKRVLDTGCSGIIVPFVNSASYARKIVSLSKYPPMGERSIGVGRAHGFGLNFAEYLESANAQTSVIIQIEHREAVSNVDQILAVPGIDAIFIGPYDLSGSLNLTGQIFHPDVAAAISTVRAACASTNTIYGIYCNNAEMAQNEIRLGAKMVVVGTDILHVANSAQALLATLRQDQS